MKRFNWQIFISFNLLFTFLIMSVSGLILYFKPEGSIARWLDWHILGLGKSGWESLHTVFSFLFLAFALFHILKIHLFNLRAYIVKYKPARFHRELYISLLITAVFLVGTALYLPPFPLVYEGGTFLSEQWAKLVEVEHESVGPRQSLEEVGAELGLDSAGIRQWQAEQDLGDLSMDASLMDNAERNGLTPQGLYDKMTKARQRDITDTNRKIYKNITITEMAVILEVEPEKIQELIRKHYGKDSVPFNCDLLQISGMVDQPPDKVKDLIMKNLG